MTFSGIWGNDGTLTGVSPWQEFFAVGVTSDLLQLEKIIQSEGGNIGVFVLLWLLPHERISTHCGYQDVVLIVRSVFK